jgi:multiple sugar transport system permease protein
MVPSIVTFMPLFVLISNMGLVNTHAGLILPFVVGALGVFLMRQFISSIPDDLLDAARVDGAGEYTIFFKIVLPLCGPALATLAILTFLGSWNAFLWPLVVASTEDMYTLPVALSLFSIGQQETNVALQMAGALVVVLPVVILFFAMQRFITQGIATTGIK